MKTQSALELFQYWNRLRKGAIAPSRISIEPSDIRNVLASTFILESHISGDDMRFRLAGTGISNLFGRQLRHTPVRALFQDRHKPIISRLLRNCFQDGSVVVLGLDGTTRTGRSTILEIIFLPLNDETDGHRILGCIAPHQYQFWHGLDAVSDLDLHSIRVLDPNREQVFLNNRPEVELAPPLAPKEEQLRAEPMATPKRELQLIVIHGGKAQEQAGTITKR